MSFNDKQNFQALVLCFFWFIQVFSVCLRFWWGINESCLLKVFGKITCMLMALKNDFFAILITNRNFIHRRLSDEQHDSEVADCGGRILHHNADLFSY